MIMEVVMARPRTRKLRQSDFEDRLTRANYRIKLQIANYIVGARKRRGWTQKELANKLGVSQSWISMMENPNDRAQIPMGTLELVYETTGVEYLIHPGADSLIRGKS